MKATSAAWRALTVLWARPRDLPYQDHQLGDRARAYHAHVARASESSRSAGPWQVSASAYYERKTGQRSRRSLQHERLLDRIEQVHAANYYA